MLNIVIKLLKHFKCHFLMTFRKTKTACDTGASKDVDKLGSVESASREFVYIKVPID